MNKYLLALLGALLMIISFSSCTDQKEIDITYHHEVVIEINTTDLYQNCGLDISKVKTMIGSGYLPCVNVLLYNTDGTLKYTVESINNTLKTLSISLEDMDEKEYTVIVLQSLEKVDLENKENNDKLWTIYNTQDINEVRVQSKYYTINWYQCLGLDAQKIDVKSGRTFKITPKLAGCLVDLSFENLYKYYDFGLYFKDKVAGLYLNPEIKGHDKFYYSGYNESNIWNKVGGINSNGLNFSFNNSYFFLDTGRINYCIGLSTEDDYVDGHRYFTPYPSNDSYFDAVEGEFYEGFCYYNGESNKISTYMGVKSEFNNWYSNLEKWKRPQFEQPYLKWGASVEEVKKYMKEKGYQIWYDTELIYDNYFLGYFGINLEDNIQYEFATATGDLICSALLIYESRLSLSQILNIFDDDSQYWKTNDFQEIFEEYGLYLYVNDTTQVQMYLLEEEGTKYVQIEYWPRSYYEDQNIYMVGTINNWTFSPDWKFTAYDAEATLYYLLCPEWSVVQPKEEFRIATEDWTTVNLGLKEEDQKVEMSQSTYLYPNAEYNIRLRYGWSGICWVDIKNNLFAYGSFDDYVPPFVSQKTSRIKTLRGPLKINKRNLR